MASKIENVMPGFFFSEKKKRQQEDKIDSMTRGGHNIMSNRNGQEHAARFPQNIRREEE
jgi:hypothetical protein